MKVITRVRRGGKTTELIKECAKEKGNACIVCLSRKEAERIFYQAEKMKLKIPFPITFDELMQKRYIDKRNQRFYIDNADLLLQSLISSLISMITLTIEDEQKE